MIIEVCANSLQSALNAQSAGADRIELCSELGIGGITPSYGLLKKVREALQIPVHVLIRPRSGDFTYSNEDFEVMKEDIEQCVNMGFHGIVSGVLNTDFAIDLTRTTALIQAAGDLSFTFHRAFDWVRDPMKGLRQLEDLGVDSILSSGQKESVGEGLPLLKELKAKAKNCVIMPGGGVNSQNAEEIKQNHFQALHLSGTRLNKTLAQPPNVPMNSAVFLAEDSVAISDIKVIQRVVEIVK